jgi:hypothetical protein
MQYDAPHSDEEGCGLTFKMGDSELLDKRFMDVPTYGWHKT